MGRLKFEDIASKPVLVTVEFHVPEWDGEVLLRSIDKEEMNAIRASITDDAMSEEEKIAEYEKRIFLVGMVDPQLSDEQYDMLFSGKEEEGVEKQAAGTINKILNKILELSKIGKDDLKEIGRNFSKRS